MIKRSGRAALVVAIALGAAGLAFADADFSNFVAIGGSLSAGFSNGGLVETFQENSLPALLDRQFTAYSGSLGAFEQPLISEPGIPNTLELISLSPLTLEDKPGEGAPLNLGLPRPYDNLAVPGANAEDAVETVTDEGGFHDLILRGLGTQLQQALALEATFASVWLGSNDVLGAATSGLVIEGVTLTPVEDFASAYATVIETLDGAGVDLVVGTIPDVTAIPFVSTIPPVVLDPATNEPLLVGGQPVPLFDANGPLSLADKVLLTATFYLENGCGIPDAIDGGFNPGVCPDGALPNSAVLDAEELATILDRSAALNQIIIDEASAVGAAIVDIEGIFNELAAEGLDIGGVGYDVDFLGGLFGYDGVHPTAFGYAYAANEFIAAINETYGTSVPYVDLFPFVFGGLSDPPAMETSTTGFVYTEGMWTGLQASLGAPPPDEVRRLEATEALFERRQSHGTTRPALGPGSPLRQSLRERLPDRDERPGRRVRPSRQLEPR